MGQEGNELLLALLALPGLLLPQLELPADGLEILLQGASSRGSCTGSPLSSTTRRVAVRIWLSQAVKRPIAR